MAGPAPLPANFNAVPVDAYYLSFDEEPVVGTVTFTPSIPFLLSPSSKAIILSKPIVGKVVAGRLRAADGVSPLRLFAVDDPDVSAQGWTYNVREELTGGAGRPPFDIAVPVASTDYGLDLWNLAVAPAPGAPSPTYASGAAVSEIVARVAALELGGAIRVVRVANGAPMPARPNAEVVFWYSQADPGSAALVERDIWIPTT